VDYAHTPQSLASILTEARALATGRVITVFGSAGERDVEKRALQGAVAAELADYSVFTSEDPRYEKPTKIIEDIASGALRSGAIEGVDFDLVEDRQAAIEHVIGQAQPGDVVILAGKGHERSMIYGAEQRPWNEAEVARLALERLGYQRRGQ
jgi:UDP-N-acetylmuramoyl-L-alanyl-D-glutamate--2,6-diaminopimelate ligase